MTDEQSLYKRAVDAFGRAACDEIIRRAGFWSRYRGKDDIYDQDAIMMYALAELWEHIPWEYDRAYRPPISKTQMDDFIRDNRELIARTKFIPPSILRLYAGGYGGMIKGGSA